MDPYIERQRWTSFHHTIVREFQRQLVPQVQPKYLAFPIERNEIEVFIEIRNAAQRELVTAIEILSPTNKRGAGREEYLQKRARLLCSKAHLLEIDLLRGGQRVPMQQPLPLAPYFVFLSRAERRPITQVWPIQLDQRLPTVPVPLLPEDDDVSLELQPALNATYHLLRYDLALDYSQPLSPPVDTTTAEWIHEQLP